MNQNPSRAKRNHRTDKGAAQIAVKPGGAGDRRADQVKLPRDKVRVIGSRKGAALTMHFTPDEAGRFVDALKQVNQGNEVPQNLQDYVRESIHKQATRDVSGYPLPDLETAVAEVTAVIDLLQNRVEKLEEDLKEEGKFETPHEASVWWGITTIASNACMRLKSAADASFKYAVGRAA